MYLLLLFSASLFSASLLPSLPHYALTLAAFSLGIGCIYRRYTVSGIVIIGVCVGIGHGYYILSRAMPIEAENKPITLEGVIESIPIVSEKRQRFIVRVTDVVNASELLFDSGLKGKKIQLTWYSAAAFNNAPQAVLPQIRPGQKWQWVVKLRRPRGFVNPQGFDYQAYLIRQDIVGVGYVLSTPSPVMQEETCFWLSVHCLRWRVLQYLLAHSTSETALGTIVALSVGDGQYLSRSHWAVLRDTGTIHLLAISGLHIGLAAGLGFFLGLCLCRLYQMASPSSNVRQYWPSYLSVMFALLYSLLAGMSLPTQRALVMFVVFHLGVLFCRRVNPYHLLWLALVFIALSDPLAAYSQGFWLSFLAVLILISGFYGKRSSHPIAGAFGIRQFVVAQQKLTMLLQAQGLLFMGLFLPSLFWLQGVSIVAPLANLFAVAYVSLLLVPLIALYLALLPLLSLSICGAGCESFVVWIYGLAESVTVGLLLALSWLSQASHGLGVDAFQWLPVSQPSVWAMALCVFGIVIFMLPRGVPYRHWALVCCLPVFFPSVHRSPLTVTFLDVGQGTAVVVETPNHQLVYDVGRAYSDQFNVGEHIVAPYLRSRGIDQIDTLIVSHSDTDHSGGLVGLLSAMPTQRLLAGQAVESGSTPVELCQKGQSWQWDEVSFTLLWPASTDLRLSDNDNNHSCVLLIAYKNRKILLTGDIEASVEKAILSNKEASSLLKQIDISLVPHHGSRTSSTPSWVKQIKPLWAVVTAGYNNTYGHPHPSIQRRYQREGSQLLNTAESGFIQFSWNDDGQYWNKIEGRSDARRYWYE